MKLLSAQVHQRRRGAVILLTALMIVFILAMVAFSLDMGYILVVRNRLQVAADAAALAGAANIGNQTAARTAAKAIASQNIAGSASDMVSLADSDILFGNWSAATRSFTLNGTPNNACRVTARRTALPLFFAPVLGISTWDVVANGETTATVNPRDIAFVIDLSGSMNNDSEIWATNAINAAFPGYPTVGTDTMQAVFTDFGYGTYPGTVNHIGQGYLPATQLNANAYNYLANTFLLNNATYGTTYKVLSTDSSATRKTKAYSFLIDKQLAILMPAAKPAVTTANLAYWTDYLDYVINSSVSNQPPSQSGNRMSGMGNPYSDAWPSLTSSTVSGYYNKIGYQTYVQFMMDMGRNMTPGGKVVPLSASSPDCPMRLDTDASSAGYGYYFPPREQPTHALRVAVMAAVNKIATLNTGVPGNVKDHVSLITFDTSAGAQVRYPLSSTDCDYAAVKSSLRTLQAVGDNVASTASEKGLLLAKSHLDPAINANARTFSTKMIIFLTDGLPNIKESSSTTVDTYVSGNSAEWFTSGASYYRERNAAMMQVSAMNATGWPTYAVGIGLGCDRSMLDRMARLARTAITDPSNPTGPKISPYADGNPGDYQNRLTSMFNEIVKSGLVTLVK